MFAAKCFKLLTYQAAASSYAAAGVIGCLMTSSAMASTTPMPEPTSTVSFSNDSTPDKSAWCASGDGDIKVAKPSIVAHTLNPTVDDTGIYSDYDECHFFVEPSAQPASGAPSTLFVFLDGTNTHAVQYKDLLLDARTANDYGVSITYRNDQEVGKYCVKGDASTNDPACTEKMRQEVIEGHGAYGATPLSNGVTVDTKNSIVQRLTDFLNYQVINSPGKGWDAFITNGTVNWSKIIVAGHSQGAGDALYIARLFPVARAVALSGSEDRTPAQPTSPAPWLNYDSNWNTKQSNLYALIHTGDGGENKDFNPTGSTPAGGRCEVDDPNDPNYVPQTDPSYIDSCHAAYQGWLALGISPSNYQTSLDAPGKPRSSDPSPPGPALIRHDATAMDQYAPQDARDFWATKIFAPVGGS